MPFFMLDRIGFINLQEHFITSLKISLPMIQLFVGSLYGSQWIRHEKTRNFRHFVHHLSLDSSILIFRLAHLSNVVYLKQN